MLLSSLDAIKIWDTHIDPENWKRWVCICPMEGLFYRINTYDDFPIGVSIPRDPNHSSFLQWDSYIECGKHPMDLDDYSIEKALSNTKGVPFGKVNPIHAAEIYAAVQIQAVVSHEVKELIRVALGC